MKVNREDFLARLESVSYGTTKHELLEQSSCFVFSKGVVFTFNDNVACQNKSLLEKAGVGAVSAAPTLQILRKLRDEEIDVELTDREMLVRGKGRKQACLTLQKEILLPLESLETPGSWVGVHADFMEAINAVARVASTLPADPLGLKCVHLTPGWVEASDCHQICRWTLPTGMSQNALVRKEDVKHLAALDISHFSEGKSWLHFRNNGGLIYSCRRYLEDFPNLEKYLDTAGEPVTLPKGLAEAVDRAGVFAGQDLIRVTLAGGEGGLLGRLTLLGVGPSGRYQESRKVAYRGPPLEFTVSPKTLTFLAKRHPECRVGAGKLMVKDGNYTYLTCLNSPESGGEG